MNPILLSLCIIFAAYLVGSIPFAVVCSRVFGLDDPRTYGSKNPGATNVLRSGNKAAAVFTLLGDLAKGALAVLLARKFAVLPGMIGEGTLALVALAVFFGHVFPLFLKFKGGKGVATGAGVLLAIDWRLGLAVVCIWLLVAFVSRYSSLAALIAAASSPLIAFILWGGDEMSLAVLVIALALAVKHWGNLQRLMAGTESKINGGSVENKEANKVANKLKEKAATKSAKKRR